ncbi:MAG: hypothetical protein ACLR3E_01550 [Enterococcus durans]
MEKNTEFKKERNQEHDTWLIFLCSSFAFLLGCVVNSFMSSDLGFSEFIPTIGALLAGIISYWGSKKNTADTLKIQKEINDQNNSFQEDMQKSQIDADITANAQIQWIQTTRKLSADFISECFQVLSLVETEKFVFHDGISKPGEKSVSASVELSVNESDNVNKLKDKVDEIKIQKHWNVMDKGTTLALMFGPSEHEENNFIVFMIESLRDVFSSTDRLSEEYARFLNSLLEDFSNILRTYYKAEWKRASLQLNDVASRKYFIEHDIYKKIKDKYWNYFESNIDLTKPTLSSKGLEFKEKKYRSQQ